MATACQIDPKSWDCSFSAFCNVSNFTALDDSGQPAACFTKLVVLIPLHFLLLLVVAFYSGLKRKRTAADNSLAPVWPDSLARLLLVILFALCCAPILRLVILVLFGNYHDFTENCLQIVSYSTFLCVLVYVRRVFISSYTSLPGFVSITIALTLLMTGQLLQLVGSALAPRSRHLYVYFLVLDSVYAFLLVLAFIVLSSLVLVMTFRQTEALYTHNMSQPSRKPGMFSSLFFCWLLPLLKIGSDTGLRSLAVLLPLPPAYRSQVLAQEFTAKLAEIRSETTSERRLILPALFYKLVGIRYFLLGILKLVGDLLQFSGPLLLNLLVTYIEDTKEPTADGIYYALGLSASAFLASLLQTHFNYQVSLVGLRLRSYLVHAVFNKALSTNSAALSHFSSGEIINFMNSDSDRIVNFCPSFHAFWSLPLQIAIVLLLLYKQLGPSCLSGVAFTILLIPVNYRIAVKIGDWSGKMMKHKDDRIKLLNDTLSGIRSIKFFSWERLFEKSVSDVRGQELKYLKYRKYLDALCVYLWATTPVLIPIFSFGTYVLLGNQLTAARVFTSLALFNMMVGPLNAFPWVVNGLVEAWVSVRRVDRFVRLADVEYSRFYDAAPRGEDALTSLSVSLTNTAFSIDGVMETISDISFKLPREGLFGIVGPVGSGKSLLLQGILAEFDKSFGGVYLFEQDVGVAYYAQEPWLQDGTVRDNILFGAPQRQAWYDEVVAACALTDDFLALSRGDLTQVGDGGANLSGGQRARVALARAVYQRRSVVFLDEPFASLDTVVAAHIYKHCIRGLLADVAVVLVTGHLEYVADADWVVVMSELGVAKQGIPRKILSDEDLASAAINGQPETVPQATVHDEGAVELTSEEMEVGSVGWSVLASYLSSAGVGLCVLVSVSLVFMQATRNGGDVWLSYWTNATRPHASNVTTPSNGMIDINPSDDTIDYYLVVYTSIAVGNTCFTLARAFLFAYAGYVAARVVHKRLLKTVFMAPIAFFSSTPLGRILNRFSTDTYTVDDSLPFQLNIFLAQLLGLLGSFTVICISLPEMVIILLPLLVVYYFLQRHYRSSSRDLKRLCAISLSPLYSHYAETLAGLRTIRALRRQRRFTAHNLDLLDDNQQANFNTLAASQWLNISLQMIGVVVVTCVALLAVVQHQFHFANASFIGLAIAYSLNLTGLLNGVVNSFTETEKELVSVERVRQYIDRLPAEALNFDEEVPPPLSTGDIAVEFKNVMLTYPGSTVPALNGVSFKINRGEKVGIVGRTGSGKSSVFLSLFRMVDISGGDILLQGNTVRDQSLLTTRRQVAIIPQEPFLFADSLRRNVDPHKQFDDEKILGALSDVCLTSLVDRIGLCGGVGERGCLLSQGQRQLVCLARVLLSQAQVVCIDEATASVDMDTAVVVESLLRSALANRTVLVIGHRLSAVQNCDRILVMSRGKVSQFDTPDKLLVPGLPAVTS